MATKLRLQRHGKKGNAFYHIVAADARAKRDGRFIEKVGTYNPNTNPATINLDFDRALYWVSVGAQPTDTCRAILKYKGVMMKDHLNRGVAKGAHSQEQADAKFEAWMKDKAARIENKEQSLTDAASKAKADALAAEKEVNEKRAADIAARKAEAEAAVAATEEVATEEATEEAAEEASSEETAE